MGKKRYTAEEGFLTKDLLHFALDHITAAGVLFDGGHETFDSAGHLAHLGTELLLKAVLLDAKGDFPNEHDLLELLREIRMSRPQFLSSPDLERTLRHLNPFVALRYPDPKGSKSTGQEDWDEVRTLGRAIVSEMPQRLRDEIDAIDPTTKGRRVLMERTA